MKPAAYPYSDSDDDFVVAAPIRPAAAPPLLEASEELQLNESLKLLAEKEELEAAAEALFRELFREAFESMHSLPPRIRELLAGGGPGRRITADGDRRWLAFIEKELDEFGLPLTGYRRREHGGHPHMLRWLQDLKEKAGGIRELLQRVEYELLGESIPRMLLQRAAHNCCATRRPRFIRKEEMIRFMAEQVYHTLNDPCRYALHSWTSESHGRLDLHDKSRHTLTSITPRLVGIDGRIEKLLRCLRPHTDTSLRTLSIFGPGGVGKTALAMEVQRRFQYYMHRGDMYHISAAVSLSNIKSFLCDIFQQITGRTIPETTDTKDLMLRIRKNLQNKRYFILIDDLRDASVWGIIKHVFPDNNLGNNRIVITTRLRSVARSCCSDPRGIVYKMKPLNESDSTQLLMTTASGPVEDMDLILRICEGIPLLITSFADNLKKQQKMEVQNFTKHLAEFSGPQLPYHVRRALTCICRDLPVELMTLLQYMNMFPRGYMFEKDCLVMKWMAKGLTHSEGEAECHFSELVDRNIFTLVPPTGEHNLDEAEPCRWQVNNLVLQFISSITSREAFVFTGDMLTSPEPTTIGPFSEICMPRWVALHSPVPNIQGVMQTIDQWGKNVRSLAVSGLVDQVPPNKINNLVMLDLEGWKNLKDEDLLQICNSKMYLLRCLSIRKTQISKLPMQIKELCSLRALDVSHTQISKLPPQVFELGHLIKLDLRSTKIRKLSDKIVGLQKLQHLLVGGDTTLSLIKYPLSFTAALGYLDCLRVLTITCSFQQCTDEAYQDAWLSSMKKWRELESLTIHCGLGSSLEFLGSTSDPPKKLQKLKVTSGRFVSVPQWIQRLQHLSFLQITICKLAADDLKILRDLPELKSLVLGLEFIPREEIVFESEGFNELLEFSVECPVPWLTFRQGAMPKLERLQLKLCSGPEAKPESVPSGICNLKSITELVLCYNQKWCHNSSSVKMMVEAVKKEVGKHRNLIDLIINGTVHDEVQE